MTRADEHAARYREASPAHKAGWWLALILAPLYIAADLMRPEAPSPTADKCHETPSARLSIRTQAQKVSKR